MSKKSHEVRIGMSQYWVETWPQDGGYAFSARRGSVSGWSSGTRSEAVEEARTALQSGEER